MASSVESFKRVVVEGRWDGNVIPGRIEEVAREVYVRPGAHVHGGVFGDRIEVEGPCQIEKALYASRELRVLLHGDVVCESSVGCKHNVLCEEANGVLRIYGDVIAKDVTLRRTAVLGGVHGRNIRLSECVVLGPVLAENRVILENCCVLTANANELQIGPGNSVIMPFLMANESIQISAAVQSVLVGDESGQMTEEDVIEHEGGITLSLGRRLTDLQQAEGRVQSVLGYLQGRVMAGRAIASAAEETGANLMPDIVKTLLHPGQSTDACSG